MPSLPTGFITPQSIGAKSGDVLVCHPNNPGNCPCGWYHFYGYCGHLYQAYPVYCGKRTTLGGKSGFCKSPAPQNVVRQYTVYAYCQDCRIRQEGH
ncbi:hypothetical protein ANO14919_088550 [Xylariales sp. No.14919]|nr:hypothetical protein ANO14919_088550 [Xylariales sp. No.14919]